MGLFFAILLGTLIILAVIACMGIPLFAWLLEWRDVRARILTTVGCILAGVGLATFGVSLIGGEDPSMHCAAGTRYVEQSHLVGKTVVTDWWCVSA